MHVREGKLSIETDSQIKIYASSALRHGGGIYLTRSELEVKGESSYISRNRANRNGGGIYATNSSIILEEVLYFVSNEAENGGGISLEKNIKWHGTLAGNSDVHTVNFIANRATHYGGALYVDDATNPDMCAAISKLSTKPSTECFSKSVFINVSENSAGVSGSNLFGGLLDRCAVHSKTFKDYQTETTPGIMSFLNSSNINESQLNTVSSFPVRLCFCNNGQPDCNYQPESIRVSRGKTFSIDFIAYDQVHHPVNASVQCFLNSSAGGLGERQQIQNIYYYTIYSEMKYDLFTPNNKEELTFSIARGPCNNISGISKRKIMIEIICSCLIGFQISNNNETSCDCACDQVFQPYKKTECNPTTESIIRRENFWISYINHTWSN